MQTAGSSVFNLYTDPQESDSIGVRHIPMGVPLQTEMHAYMEILKNIHHARRLNLIKPALSGHTDLAGCDVNALSGNSAGGHKMAAFYLFTTIKCACIMSLAGRPCASKSAIALRYGGRWRK
ncbi:hypothetical protein BANRA_00029 [Escherichia coli]|nr:hypothetical protein BANRA_00029 [Escherichia coli]